MITVINTSKLFASTHVFGTHFVGQHVGQTSKVGEDLHALCPQVAHDDGQMLQARGKLDLQQHSTTQPSLN